MTLDERFERTLPAVLSDLYLGPTPDYRDDLLWQTARTSQRPAWRFPGRWLPMADLVTERVSAPRVPWRIVAVALVILALLIVGTVAFVGSQQPKLPPPFGVAHNGLIAFEQAGDIVTLDPATATTRVLVGGPEQDSAPLYSSDGTKIAFERAEDSGVALYVVNSDGSDPVRVTPDPIDNVLARSFSPDGRSLLVTAWIVDGRAKIFEVASDGSRPPQTLDVQLPTDIKQRRGTGLSPDGRFAGPRDRVVAWRPLTKSGPGRPRCRHQEDACLVVSNGQGRVGHLRGELVAERRVDLVRQVRHDLRRAQRTFARHGGRRHR